MRSQFWLNTISSLATRLPARKVAAHRRAMSGEKRSLDPACFTQKARRATYKTYETWFCRFCR